MSQALYRKYRSRSLDEVLGQDHITSILRRALEQGKIAHAYLLTGPRGVGKTSVARILAHEINNLPYDKDATHLDIIEIDAASNNGVDDIRSLREKAQVAPVSAAKKIYIIDEVHMLSKPAFNALLKTLEEPPAHIVFILATTDADKLPATILSRVQQFYFRPITVKVIAKRLTEIAEAEGFTIDPEAAKLIAEHSRGGFRDAISLLDQLSPLASEDEPLTLSHVTSHLGLSDANTIQHLIMMYHEKQSEKALELLLQLDKQGHDPTVLTRQLLSQLRSELCDQPANLSLISRLIDVIGHPHPDLKLMTIFDAGSPSIIDAPAPKISRTPLKQKAEERPLTPKVPDTPLKKKREEHQPEQTVDALPKKASDQANISFDWQALLDKIKPITTTGRHGMLSKSSYQLEGKELIIYAGNKLAATKLSDAVFRPQLTRVAQELSGQELDIIIKPDKKPPTDTKLAEIAAMMGGGEEVNLEELV